MELMSATRANASDIAHLTNLAGDGIPSWLWKSQKNDSETAIEYGSKRAAREEGNFSYRNAKVCMVKQKVAGMLLSYQLPCFIDLSDIQDYPPVLQPLIKLESYVAGTWYVNAIAAKPESQSKGIGSMLLKEAERLALTNDIKVTSLIVDGNNFGAKRLYERKGYNCIKKLKQQSSDGLLFNDDWILMTKHLDVDDHRVEFPKRVYYANR